MLLIVLIALVVLWLSVRCNTTLSMLRYQKGHRHD